MRLLLSAALLVGVSMTALAHHPDRENKPVRPRIEVIPPLGTSLGMSHRRKYNRPTNWGGKLMYYIAPSSQEAMAWHHATHRGFYENDSPRIVTHYFYPKPWEALTIGPRPRPATTDAPYGGSNKVEIIPEELAAPVDALEDQIEELSPQPGLIDENEDLPLPNGPDAIEVPSPSDL